MNYFRYKVITPEGKVSQNILRLPYDNELSAITFLEREGNTVIHIRRLGALASALAGAPTRKRVGRKALAELLGNLGVMQNAGLPIIASLKDSLEDIEHPALAEAVEGLIFHIESGGGLAAAMEQFPQIFPSVVRYLVRIGEETGSLGKTLQDAANHLRHVDQIISDTRQALMYPGFVIVAMTGAMVFWFYFVVPKIVRLFLEMGVDLPAITLMLLRISEFLQENIGVILLGLALSGGALVTATRRSRRFRHRLHYLLRRLPVVSRIREASSLAFLSEYLNLLIAAGVDIFRSLDIMRESIGDEVFREKLGEIRETLINGEQLTNAFKSSGIFPGFVVRMIHVGEQSGTLDRQLAFIAEEYRDRLSRLVATIGKMIEPLVLIIAGAMFGIIIFGLFLPIYDLIGAVG